MSIKKMPFQVVSSNASASRKEQHASDAGTFGFVADAEHSDETNKRNAQIFEMFQNGMKAGEIAKNFGISRNSVLGLVHRATQRAKPYGYRRIFVSLCKKMYSVRMEFITDILQIISEWDEERVKKLYKLMLNPDFLEDSHSTAKLELPATPPNGQFYKKHKLPEDTPPVFIGRVYKDWLTGDFTRADLRKLDPDAYRALYNWERTNGRAAITLPTKKEVNDQLLANSPEDETRAERLTRQRLEASRRYYQKL